MLQAILVRPIGEAGSFEVVAGTRRYRASKLAGRETIPATVRELTDAQCLELQLIENLQRSDVHELDEAQGYAALMQLRGISGNYFQAIGAPLLRGREFGAGDMANPSRVVVINQAMAAQFGPGAEPIGQQIINPYNNSSREIVGVVGNIKSFGQDAASPPEMYTLMGPTSGFSYINFVVRSATNSASLIPAVRAEVTSLDKNVAVYNVVPMDDLLARSVAPRRFNSFLFTLFAALALALANIGIYGLLSFNVSSRQHEIGVRMALGAQPRDVLQMIVIQGMRLLAVALAAGLVVSFALTRLMANLLFGVSATDVGTFAAVIILLALTALAACYIPARRAMHVDPMVALRHE